MSFLDAYLQAQQNQMMRAGNNAFYDYQPNSGAHRQSLQSAFQAGMDPSQMNLQMNNMNQMNMNNAAMQNQQNLARIEAWRMKNQQGGGKSGGLEGIIGSLMGGK